MSKIRILIHGATGETGSDLVDAFLEDGGFEIAALVRPQSAEKAKVKTLAARGIKIIIGDTAQQDANALAKLIQGHDIIISAVAAEGQLEQLVLIDAAAKVGVKRFVPCGWTTISPPGGIMDLRALKEQVHHRIWRHRLPYTIIDVGAWHQVGWPVLPSGRLEYATKFPNTTIYGDGNAPNIFTDKRDVGRFVARILRDDRTLNKRVFTCSDVLTQNQIWELMEQKSGEKISTTYESNEETVRKERETKQALEKDPDSLMKYIASTGAQYNMNRYVLQDNTPEVAKYLGYLDARELYPDFKPISFSDFLDELLDGKMKELYPDKYEHLKKPKM